MTPRTSTICWLGRFWPAVFTSTAMIENQKAPSAMCRTPEAAFAAEKNEAPRGAGPAVDMRDAWDADGWCRVLSAES